MVRFNRRQVMAICVWTMVPCGVVATEALALDAAACTGLMRLSIPDTTITSAALVAADGDLPEHCKVQGRVETEINFELRLPTTWNGKLYHRGGGGFVGSIPPTRAGLSRGYAAVGTDTGHQGSDFLDASWALGRPDRQVNWGHRSVHVVTVAAKRIIEAAYGRRPAHSYFEGCSNGGRQAAMEAQRYPEDFDGIIAGAPGLDWSGILTGWNWNQQALKSTPIPPETLAAIAKGVVSQCDAADGLADGLVDNPRSCAFDPKKLVCSGADGPACLTPAQVQTYEQILMGPRRSNGVPLFHGFPPAAEEGRTAGQLWISGSRQADGNGSDGIPLQFTGQDQFLKFFLFSNPGYNSLGFNFDTDAPILKATDAVFAAIDPDLRRFQRAGGKLIMWHGWADPAVTADGTVQYYQDVIRTLGNRESVEGFFRLFLGPGMQHCGGGPGLNSLDALTALEQWVERGVAPDAILASNDGTTGVKRTRPLCSYPAQASYVGSGDINDAKNFVCRQARSGGQR
jgi:Tannase and feruloyl esterase